MCNVEKKKNFNTGKPENFSVKVIVHFQKLKNLHILLNATQILQYSTINKSYLNKDRLENYNKCPCYIKRQNIYSNFLCLC